MDCICETNRYKLPPLLICGVTALNLLASSLHSPSFVKKTEEEEYYLWAMKCSEDVLEEEDIKTSLLPSPITSDHDLALINGAPEAFPDYEALIVHMAYQHKNVLTLNQMYDDVLYERGINTFIQDWQLESSMSIFNAEKQE